jgi:hypothetical protein
MNFHLISLLDHLPLNLEYSVTFKKVINKQVEIENIVKYHSGNLLFFEIQRIRFQMIT